MLKRILISISICATLLSCSRNYIVEDNLTGISDRKILLLPPITMKSILNHNTDDSAFEKNTYIGTINFQGGLIKNKDTEYITKSKIKNFSNQDEFLNSVKKIFSDSIIKALTDNKRNFEFLNPESGIGADTIIVPENIITEEDIIKNEFYGRDNINFPRYIYKVKGMSDNAIREFKKDYKASYIMIPLIEYYYIHDSGWFDGQDIGCSSGYRARLHVYIIETDNGRVAFSFSNDEKQIFAHKYVFDKYEMKEWQNELNSRLQKTLISIIP